MIFSWRSTQLTRIKHLITAYRPVKRARKRRSVRGPVARLLGVARCESCFWAWL